MQVGPEIILHYILPMHLFETKISDVMWENQAKSKVNEGGGILSGLLFYITLNPPLH